MLLQRMGAVQAHRVGMGGDFGLLIASFLHVVAPFSGLFVAFALHSVVAIHSFRVIPLRAFPGIRQDRTVFATVYLEVVFSSRC